MGSRIGRAWWKLERNSPATYLLMVIMKKPTCGLFMVLATWLSLCHLGFLHREPSKDASLLISFSMAVNNRGLYLIHRAKHNDTLKHTPTYKVSNIDWHILVICKVNLLSWLLILSNNKLFIYSFHTSTHSPKLPNEHLLGSYKKHRVRKTLAFS